MGLIIGQLNTFWANTETVLEVLTMKGKHAEKFVSFSRNPKLMEKFQTRIDEYKSFWEGVSAMSGTYLAGITDVEEQMSKQCQSHNDCY
jgi:7-keto-8-aminopelargonate synthetase-like enzyme